MKIEPMGARLVGRTIEMEPKKTGSIYIPETAGNKSIYVQVTDVGKLELEIDVGDILLVSAGREVQGNLLLVEEEHVLAKIGEEDERV